MCHLLRHVFTSNWSVELLILNDAIHLTNASALCHVVDGDDVSTIHNTVKPVLNGISRDQNIFPLKAGFRLIKAHYL